MKKARQSKILELINEQNIETQEELCRKLIDAGFDVTQATVSRDIRQLRLSKVPYDGGQRYVAAQKDALPALQPEKYTRVLRDGFLSMDMAQNILVIKTVPGLAMAVAAALDAMNFKEVVGCIAGDDAIFCAVRTVEQTRELMAKIKDILK